MSALSAAASGLPPPPPSLSSPSSQAGAAAAAAHDPSAANKLTRGHSCVLCQQRKVRCDKNKPCANCVKAGVECKVVPPQPPRRRKKKPQERELIDRLRKYESLLSQHGVDFEPIGSMLRPSDPGAIDEVDELEHGIEGLRTSPSSTGQDGDSKWFQYHKDYKAQDDTVRDSSDDGSNGPLIHQAFDKMFDGYDGFPFVIGGSTNSVTDLHPPAVQVFQLWQIYLDNVNPLLKITHTPTLQGQLIEAAANPAKIPKPLEALLFSIYFIALISMTDDEVMETFKEDKKRLTARYHHGSQQALINAGFMRSPDIVVLQALVMYLIAVRQFVDPRAEFCLIGIAVRVANRLGLHMDAEQFHLPPFEVEIRRRLWWQLVIFDKRIAEMTGSSITALASSRGDCKWPLNINDTDLHIHAKDRIAPYAGPTEMLFSLTRFELTVAADPDSPRQAVNLSGANGTAIKPKYQYSPNPTSSDIFTNAAHHNLPVVDLEAYIKYIEEKYLSHCDNKIPLHLFTYLMTRQALSRLRVVDYFSRGYIQRYPDPNTLPPGPDRAVRQSIFEETIRIIEYDNAIHSHDALRGFHWYTAFHFPFPAFTFLVQELRYITTGDLCERAWATIIENHEKRRMRDRVRSPLHTAIGGMIIKAWELHQAAEAQAGGRVLPQPELITFLKDVVKKMKPPPPPPSSSANQYGFPPGQRGLPGSGGGGGSSSKASVVSTSASPGGEGGGAGNSYVAVSGAPLAGDVDLHSTGSSPPMVSGPGGGGIESMAGSMFGPGGAGGAGFDGLNTHGGMFGPGGMMPGTMDLGGMMDWTNSMAPWSGGGAASFLGGGGGYDHGFPPVSGPDMATYHPAPR